MTLTKVLLKYIFVLMLPLYPVKQLTVFRRRGVTKMIAGKKKKDEYQEDQDFGLGEDITDEDLGVGVKGGETDINGDEEDTTKDEG